ncbi:MerR family transcriptional regulator [Streptomyces sp. SID5785]|uniref:MerR family transcriptional regulator n=1 Tax=Streptomyces sp. SID5785 TaxID=2690309 RepID=UPI00136187BA|nr:MerR family transcriptional regulator [Streptomyces sp. SID5785]MZD06725.1 MerR family transcriptional regulator [Streptomyces sp. SID5785]
MRIGELAVATGTTVRALRHYEQAGLLTSERAANGYRWFAPDAVTRVANIRLFLDAGLTADDVRVFLPCLDGDVLAQGPSAGFLRIARARLDVIDRRIAAQTAVRDRLAEALRTAQSAS